MLWTSVSRVLSANEPLYFTSVIEYFAFDLLRLYNDAIIKVVMGSNEKL